jgi:predicted extracellular nuclease
MILDSLRSFATRLLVVLTIGFTIRAPLSAQVALSAGTTTENFDNLAGGLPAGWSIHTGATAATLGSAATLNPAAATWANTSGAWKNLAAADNAGFTGAENDATQATASDRALGIRQTGGFGDPGAAAGFNFSTSGLQVTAISFSAQMLSVQARSTVWQLQYGIGAAPAAWTTIATFTDPAAFGATTVNGAGFGGALDNQGNVWLRVVTLAGTTGAGSRDTFGIDDFTIVTTSTGGPVAPSVTTPPAAQAVTEGGTAQFMVTASGTAPLAYQWRKDTTVLVDGGIVAGATTDTLTLTGVAVSDAGDYNVVVSNLAGTATSANASLTVTPLLVAPTITAQPTPQSVAGGTATFSVTATGTAPLAYQWRKDAIDLVDGVNISGAQTATLIVANVTAADIGSYSVVVSNGVAPDATSDAAPLTLSAVITPAGRISYAGGTYAQNFNTLPASGTYALTSEGPLALSGAPINAAGLGGWAFEKYTGTGSVALFRVEAGTGTSGAVYSYGTVNAPDRALGALASGSTISRFGVTLVNNTGVPISDVTLSYTGEQWRRGGGVVNVLAFDYGVGATDIKVGTFTAAPALDFVAPVAAGGSQALDGNLPANRAAVSGTLSGLNWAPGETLVLRWTDVNDSGNDDALAIDDLSIATPVSPADIVPTVAFVTPANGAVNVPVNSPVSVTFNTAVNVTGTWFALTGETSGAHTATVSGGPTGYTLTPDVAFDEGETVTLTVFATQVMDQATGTKYPSSDYTVSFFTFSTAPLGIHTVQGSGLASAFAGYPVTVQGVVVATFQGANGIGGYYMQEPDATQDGDAATSEGIYVFDNDNPVDVGDLVAITGTVLEYGSAPVSQTEISAVTAFNKVATGVALPATTAVSLPFASPEFPERYEGMLVSFPQTLTVTDNYDYGVFGELMLSNGRLPISTNIVAPGAAAQSQSTANFLNQILLDDGLSTLYPDPTPYLSSGDPAAATRRAGSTTAGVTGILDNRFGTYVLEPTFVPTFVDANPRAAAPAVAGRLKISIGNVLNFFNGDGAGGGYPTSRGASSFAEYQRQRDKIVAGIAALAPDIIGLTEVENDGFGPLSAIADLVNGLNAVAPAGVTYAYIDGSAVEITTDLVHVAIVYRPETVEPVGAPAMLSDPAFNNVARNPLAQTFREIATGEVFTLSVNHFRAKASVAAGAGNADSGDGQGTNNALRVQEANALTAWLATDPTASGDADFLIVGDLNAYAKEDPIVALQNAGYVNLTEAFEGVGGYSYSFDGEFGHLDHALANGPLAAQVVDAATWHVNSDEPIYYDYNTENKSVGQLAINVGTPYRYSDHDPVVVGLDLTSPAMIVASPVSQTTTTGGSVTFSVTATGTPAPTYQWRKDGEPIAGATSATYTIAYPLAGDAGSYDVVVTNSTGSVTSAAATLVVSPVAASVSLGDLEQRYDGTPRAVTATTVPAGLAMTITYNGSTTVPVYPGAYEVIATIADPSYTGSATDVLIVTTTALVRHAPTMNGRIDGSVHVLLPESTTLNGQARITGDLLMPGTPALTLNGQPNYGGTIDASGSATPSGSSYKVTLNGHAALRHLVQRVDAIPMPVVSAPPMPAGTRNVSINHASQSAGNFATLRNLTLNGNVGTIAVPAGTYGAFTANGGSGLRLGVVGGTTPAVYNLQSLTINGNATVEIVGPVILNLRSGVSLNGSVGNAAHPEWLELNVASGGVTLNGNVSLAGAVVAPSGAVIVNGNSTLTGRVVSDRLTLNGNGRLK